MVTIREIFKKSTSKTIEASKEASKSIAETSKSITKGTNKLLDLGEIYVQPTLHKGRMEGAPIAILEAMSNGKVVIGSDIPGIKDQLKEFPSQLFKAGDYNELNKKLVFHMSNNIEDNIEFGRKFVNIAKNKYDISIEKKKIEEFYRKLLD